MPLLVVIVIETLRLALAGTTTTSNTTIKAPYHKCSLITDFTTQIQLIVEIITRTISHSEEIVKTFHEKHQYSDH